MSEIGNSAVWYVPLGLKAWFARHGIERCVELDWWQEHSHDDYLTVVGAPIQHWWAGVADSRSGRHFFDVNSSLWASFICKTASHSFFHCGDTGYCTAFKEIGDRYGPFTFAALRKPPPLTLAIGSYEPRYFMCHQHMNPYEACLVHQDLRATYSIGVHWATFMMSDEHYMDPKKDFEAARIELGLADGACFTSHLGETIVLH
ncbi:hypothetical protein HDU91_005281 [Kappamyces sp. JEL0680]|nr:hypothetical protein HDU91_005281 [Kappamyces sp. JEL0680]